MTLRFFWQHLKIKTATIRRTIKQMTETLTPIMILFSSVNPEISFVCCVFPVVIVDISSEVDVTDDSRTQWSKPAIKFISRLWFDFSIKKCVFQFLYPLMYFFECIISKISLLQTYKPNFLTLCGHDLNILKCKCTTY